MPTYEYKCDKCGRVFEKFQSMKDDPLTECDTCGGSVQRLIGAGAALIFKGSGFYETDYKRKSSAPAATETENTHAKKAETANPDT